MDFITSSYRLVDSPVGFKFQKGDLLVRPGGRNREASLDLKIEQTDEAWLIQHEAYALIHNFGCVVYRRLAMLPCPFCGGTELDIEEGGQGVGCWITCQTPECYMTFGSAGVDDRTGDECGFFDTAEEAITAWNRRPKLRPKRKRAKKALFRQMLEEKMVRLGHPEIWPEHLTDLLSEQAMRMYKLYYRLQVREARSLGLDITAPKWRASYQGLKILNGEMPGEMDENQPHGDN